VTLSLLSRAAEVPFAFVDVETTGASPAYGDRVIEVGVARVEAGKVVATYQQLVDPQRTVGPGITALTGISPDMLVGQPTFRDVASDVLSHLRGAVIIGHNVPFDLGFLRNEFRLAGKNLVADLGQAHVIDTVRLARSRHGRGGNGLQSLARRFDVLDTTAHRALADCLTTHRVFEKLTEERGGWSMTLVDLIQSQGGIVRLEGKGNQQALPLELEEALGHGQPVEMEYVDVRSERTVRVITPIEVKRFRGEMILLAYCAMRRDRRTFKVDRIVRLTRIDPDSQTTHGPPTPQD
jgi:DNA polymerase III epsilon subunit family exonuclease